jgi:hypothetical protein
MTRATILPLPLAISAAQISAELATALERVSVTVSLDGVRRMLVDAAQAVAENRADLEGLLKAAGRLMDHFEPGWAERIAREGIAEGAAAARALPTIGSRWTRPNSDRPNLAWIVESIDGQKIHLNVGRQGADRGWVPIDEWPRDYVPTVVLL